jgi:hypothetical protein
MPRANFCYALRRFYFVKIRELRCAHAKYNLSRIDKNHGKFRLQCIPLIAKFNRNLLYSLGNETCRYDISSTCLCQSVLTAYTEHTEKNTWRYYYSLFSYLILGNPASFVVRSQWTICNNEWSSKFKRCIRVTNPHSGYLLEQSNQAFEIGA